MGAYFSPAISLESQETKQKQPSSRKRHDRETNPIQSLLFALECLQALSPPATVFIKLITKRILLVEILMVFLGGVEL